MTATKRNFFYEQVEVNVADFPNEPQVTFGFDATRVILANDSDEQISFSFLKPNLDGDLFERDGPIVFDEMSEGRLWFKRAGTGVKKIRVWGWRR